MWMDRKIDWQSATRQGNKMKVEEREREKERKRDRERE